MSISKIKPIVIIIAIAFVLLFIPSTSYADEIDIKLTKFIDWGTSVFIHYEGQAWPEFYGYFILYDKDGEKVDGTGIWVEDDGSFGGSYQTAKNSSNRIFDEGIGYLEVFLDPKTSGQDHTSILIQKVPIKFFKPLQQAHPIKIINGEFIPNHITIPVYDRIKLIPDCDDCYKPQMIVTDGNNEERNIRIELETHSLNVEGVYKISDMFEPKSELIIQVVFPDPLLEESPMENKQKELISNTEPQTQIDPQSLQLESGGLELTQKIPDWVKNIFVWYGQDRVSEDELLNTIKFLITEEIITIVD